MFIYIYTCVHEESQQYRRQQERRPNNTIKNICVYILESTICVCVYMCVYTYIHIYTYA